MNKRSIAISGLATLGILGFISFQNLSFLPYGTYGSVAITAALDTQIAINEILSRAITMQTMTDDPSQYPQSQIDEDMQMIDEIKPTMIGRWGGWWGSSWDGTSDDQLYARAVTSANRIHTTNPQTVLEAAVFEYVNANVNNFPVPAWAFTELGMPVQTRNFNYNAMKFDDFATNSWHRMGNDAVPDMTKPEARLWLYYRARRFIDSGAEAIHLGQAKLMSDRDTGYTQLWNLVAKIRAYGRLHARRNRVLMNAHTGGNMIYQGYALIFDFNESPSRPRENGTALSNAVMDPTYEDSIYTHSWGGTTPGGEIVSADPYLVEFDNYGIRTEFNSTGQRINPPPGTVSYNYGLHQVPPIGDWFVFGYDEITWFSYMAEADRNNWLAYAVNWLKTNDPNGHLEMPGRRGTTRPGVSWPGVIYRANRGYFNQVAEIKCLWVPSSCVQVQVMNNNLLPTTTLISPQTSTTATVVPVKSTQ